jgi:histidinol-phosphate aminotransferase
LRAHHGIDAAQVFVGNGSDEVLAHAFFAFFQQGTPLLMPDVTYSFYEVYCPPLRHRVTQGTAGRAVPHSGGATLPATPMPGGVVIANPNAPTGMRAAAGRHRALVQSQPGGWCWWTKPMWTLAQKAPSV